MTPFVGELFVLGGVPDFVCDNDRTPQPNPRTLAAKELILSLVSLAPMSLRWRLVCESS
jgi:hypothetical protein